MQLRENRLTLSEALGIALTIFRLFSVTAAARYYRGTYLHSAVEKFNYLPYGHLISHKFCALSFEVPTRSRPPSHRRTSVVVVDYFCYDAFLADVELRPAGFVLLYSQSSSTGCARISMLGPKALYNVARRRIATACKSAFLPYGPLPRLVCAVQCRYFHHLRQS